VVDVRRIPKVISVCSGPPPRIVVLAATHLTATPGHQLMTGQTGRPSTSIGGVASRSALHRRRRPLSAGWRAAERPAQLPSHHCRLD